MILWEIEESIEDAIVLYLQREIRDGMKFYTGWTDQAIEYPCAAVLVGEANPLGESTEWSTQARFAVQVDVATEAAPEKDGTGTILRTARERNTAARSAVMNALAISTLADELNAMGVSGLAVSLAQVVGRKRDTQDRHLVTSIMLDVIAAPGSQT
jgi:hypothetical protein